MKPILDIDFLFISGYIALVDTFKEINPYIVFIGGIIAILVGIGNIIKFWYWLKDRRQDKKSNE